MWFLFPLQIDREYNGEVEDPKGNTAMKIKTISYNTLFLVTQLRFKMQPNP